MKTNFELIKLLLKEHINKSGESDAIEFLSERGLDYAVIPRDYVFSSIEKLRCEFDFDMLMDLFAVDYLKYNPLPYGGRFGIITHLYSIKNGGRLFIKSYYPEKFPEADSLVPLYPAANWFEREIFDMYGIKFKGHPDLRRILMYEGFDGHPLRKDYDIKKRQPLTALIKKEYSVFKGGE